MRIDEAENGFGPNGPRGPKNHWTYGELATLWRNPSMTARELAELLPGRTPKAVNRARARFGRYRERGVTPLCQKCGEHPVDMMDREAKRWGLCKACAVSEKEWRDRHAAELRRRNDARRQRRHNDSKGDRDE